MDNVTDASSPSVVGIRDRHSILNSMAVLVSTVTFTIHIMFLVVLKRCRRLPTSIKLLSFNLLTCNIIVLFLFIITTVVLLLIDEDYLDVIFYTRILMVCSPYAVSWSTTVGFAIERLITLTNPFHSQRWLQARKCVLFLVLAWILNCVVPVIVMILRVSSACQWNIVFSCLSAAFDIHRIYFTVLFATNSITILYAFVKITLVVKDQVRKIQEATVVSDDVKRNQFLLTKVILGLILVYTIFHLPILAFCIVFLVNPEWQVPDKQILFQSLTFLSVILNSYITMYLYFWKIPECRMNVLLLYCFCSRVRREQARELKLTVFNIVTIRDS